MAGLSDFLGTDSTDTTAPAGGAAKSTAPATTATAAPPAEAAPPPTTPTLSNFLQGDSAPDIGGTRTGGDTRAGSLAGSEKNIGTSSVGDMGDFSAESLATGAERGAAGLASLPRTVQDFLTPNPEIAKDVYSRMAPWRRPKEGDQPVIPKWPWTSEDVMKGFTEDLGLPNYQPKTAPGRVFQSGIAGAVGGLPFGPAGIMAGLFGGGAQQTAAEMNLPRPVQVAAGIVAPLLLHAPGAGVRQLTRSLGESGEKSIAIKALDESSDDPNAPINDSPIAGTPRTTGTATGDQGLLSMEKRAFQRSDKAQADFIRIKTAANQAARDHLATVGTIPDAGEATLQLQNEATNMASYVKRGANAAKTAERTAWQQVDPHDQLNVTSQAVRADLDLARRNLGVEREDLVPSYVDDIAGKWGPTVSLNGLKNLSSRLLSDIRGWSSGPSMDLNRAQAAGRVQRVVQRYLDSLAATDPVQQANLDAARTATRNYHTVYDNDITKRVIGQTSSGQDLVDETHVGDKYLASGRPEDLTQYVQATGGTPQAMGAARNWLLAKLFDAGEARAGDSGFLINSRVSQFVRKYQGLLNDTRLFSPAERDAVQRSADQLNFTARTEGAGMRAGSPTYANLASAGNVANTILGPRGMQFARTLSRMGKGVGAAGIARLATNYGINPTEAIAFFLGSEGRTGEGLSNWIAGKAARIQDHIHQALADPEYYEHLRTFRRGPVSRGPQTLGGAGLGTYTSQNPPGAPVPPADPTQQGQARGGRVGLAAGGPLEEGLDTEGEAGFDIPFDIPHAPSIPAYPGAETGELPGRGGVSGGAGELAPSHRPSPGYGGSAPLAGLPARISIPKLGRTIYAGPSERIRQVAGNYMAGVGQPDNPPSEYLRVDPARGARIAQAYHEMQHDPEDPLVKASYRAMAEETLRQYRHIKKAGLKPEFFWGDDPYEASPRLVTEDIANNNHMWVYPTDRGFGTQPITEEDIAKNPMLAMTKEKFNGQPARVNDIFRVVHDYFGHAKEGVGFRADGEENAWNSHARMYSPLARIAMTAETRGQNSWLNWGPHGVENRTAPTEKTVFADQKQGIMPDWVYHEGAPGLAPIDIADMRRQLAGPKQLAAGKGKVTPEKFRQLADINAAALGLPQSKELSQQIAEGKKASEKLPDTGLFDLSLSTLGRMPRAQQHELKRYQAQSMPEKWPEIFEDPEVRRKMLSGLTPHSIQVGKAWYNTDQLRDAFEQELGAHHGPVAFQRFLDYVAATSARSNVVDNIRNASFQYWMEHQGLHPNEVNPFPYPYGHMAQNVHRNAASMIRAGGMDIFTQPKRHSFRTNLAGNLIPVTADAHLIRAIGMQAADPRFLAQQLRRPLGKDLSGQDQFETIYPQRMFERGEFDMPQALQEPTYWESVAPKNVYPSIERYTQGLGREFELPGAQTQAGLWIGHGGLTGLGSEPAPFMSLFDQVLQRTAHARGEDPHETLRHFIHGTKPLYEEGGGVGYAEGGEVEGGLGAGESTAEQQGLAMPVVRTPSQTGLTTVPGDGWYRDRTYDVLVNPTKGEVYEQARNAPHNSIRMFRANDGKVYSWNGHDFLHHQMALKLGIQDFGDSTEAILHQGKLVQAYDGRIYRDDDGTLIPMWGQDTWFRKPARGERSIFRPPGKRGGRIGFAAGGGFTAYHGSPHTFDAFDASKIGTGEGAQSYGHGLYFAENPGVAGAYKDTLSAPKFPRLVVNKDADGWGLYDSSAGAPGQPQKLGTFGTKSAAMAELDKRLTQVETATPAGSLYKVNIDAEPEHFLDWDKPLSEQHPHVQKAVAQTIIAHNPWLDESNAVPGAATGQDIYHSLGFKNPADTARAWQQAGIPGIRYLDQGSRDPKNIADLRAQIAQMEPWSGNPQFDQSHVQNQLSQLRAELQRAENPTHNYVVFDPSKLSILERNKRGGRIDMQKGGRVK